MSIDEHAHTELLASLATFIRPGRYLEVGVRRGETFSVIRPMCKEVVGIDKKQLETIPGVIIGDSAEVLPTLDPPFDLIFLDSSHEKEATRAELKECIRLLSPLGVLVLHDTVPPEAKYRAANRCGDVCELLPEMYASGEIQVITVPGQYGLTLVQRTPA